ncbi:hypothetical protein KSP40_PGU012462 [Platanthera guangdongensis]|uniref:ROTUNDIFOLIA like 8 n=1 Tax=Platanthera guangdongensis TaxID=2320717 RepID=A0ABR2LZB1_9ASPA
MDLYTGEKWKLAKAKGSRGAGSRREPSNSTDGVFLKRSSSLPETRASAVASASRPRSFTGRCGNLVKEQRARFYIMRRCVTMLICWRDYS